MRKLSIVAAIAGAIACTTARVAVAQADAPRPPPPRRVPTATLPDEIIVRALDAGRPAFLRCWARAQRDEPRPIASKVKLHLELDDQARITRSECDSDSPALTSCLLVVARRLPFPAPGQPVSVDLPLIFR